MSHLMSVNDIYESYYNMLGYPIETYDDLAKLERPLWMPMHSIRNKFYRLVCYKTCQTWASSDFDGLLQKLLLGNISSIIGVPRERARIEAQDAHAQHTRAPRERFTSLQTPLPAALKLHSGRR